ncbi:MAG: flagellar transcriptional regulator FlhD [gamma proteobacterium endosymbiont of Lamellibrachia anaximandri]|nr:flagellar transcriptional regulator FlhD [gamma proteobacterium endosymbiont of Lamellibrachia anaximandri]
MRSFQQDLIDLNFSWLVTAREMTQTDRIQASMVLGLDPALMERIACLSLQELRAIARSEFLLFHPRFHPSLRRELIESDPGHSPGILLQTLITAAQEASG